MTPGAGPQRRNRCAWLSEPPRSHRLGPSDVGYATTHVDALKSDAYVHKINEKLGWKVKPLVRFIKAWKYFQRVPISSFYLELRVAKYAEGESSIVYEFDVNRIFT